MDAHCETRRVALPNSSNASSWQQRPAVAILVLLALGSALVWRLYLGPTVLHDSLAIYWTWADQFTAELARGNLYPRWLSLSNAGLGAPVFYYYPPLAFYLAAAFSFAGLSTANSIFAVFWCAFASSGLGCWYWLRGRSNHPLAGAAFFMAAPYHLFDYVDRGALAESVAIAFIPILAIGLRRIGEKRGGVALAAAAFGTMIVTHLPLALLAGLFLVGPYAIRHVNRLREFALASLLGVGAAAIYLLPAVVLSPYHDGAKLYRVPDLRTDYWSLFSGHWSDPTFAMIFLIVGAIIVAAAAIRLRAPDPWATLAIAVAAIVAGLIPFFWSLPVLRDVQFPYRALPIAEFALATALARLPSDGRALLPAAMPLLVSAIVLPGFYRVPVDMERLRAVHPDVYEYLPRGVLTPDQTSATLREVLAPRSPPPHVQGMVVEPYFYFPAWSCGSPEPTTQLLMHEPACRPTLVTTLAEKFGLAISALSSLLLMLIAMQAVFPGIVRSAQKPKATDSGLRPGCAERGESA